MSKRAQQCGGILAAVIAYYFVREGAPAIRAFTGVFRPVTFMGLGVHMPLLRVPFMHLHFPQGVFFQLSTRPDSGPFHAVPRHFSLIYVSIPAKNCLVQRKNSSPSVTLGVFRYPLPVSPVSCLVAVFGVLLQIRIPVAADGMQPFAQVVVRTSRAWISSMDAKSTLQSAGMMSVNPCFMANSAAGQAVNS